MAAAGFIMFGIGASAFARSSTLYTLDASWQPTFPAGAHQFSGVGIAAEPPVGSGLSGSLVYVTQRGDVTLDPVLVMNGTNGSLVRSWGKEHVAASTDADPSWGAHGITVEACSWPCVQNANMADAWHRVYIEDFTGHTLRSFSSTGEMLLSVGTPGVAGNGTSPIQFDHVADADVATGSIYPGRISPTLLYASDGDGGSNNRVVKLSLPATTESLTRAPPTLEWATPARYANPHSIALHKRSGLLVVANRELAELRLLREADGTDLGVLDCGLGFGARGKPYGVRSLSHRGRDLLFVASMDNPQDHKNQRISVVDVSGLTETSGARSPCTALQTLQIPSDDYSGPHLLGVNERTGDLYAALVADAPRSTVLRFTCTGC